jgi:hypothetical protein
LQIGVGRFINRKYLIEILMKRNKKSIFSECFLITKKIFKIPSSRWCESSGQAALFYSSTDEQINTAKQKSIEVPHERFCGGSCTPDGGERPTFFISFLPQNFIRRTKLSLTPIWCYGIVLMCH